jgi:hypothetical protein
VDIEEFYEADERRRQSSEIELGTEWRDDHNIRYELNWVQDTGEVYVMREPAPYVTADPFGGIHTDIRSNTSPAGMTVAVVARIATRDELERVFNGWQTAMARSDGIAWLVERISTAGAAVTSPDAPS